MSEPAPIECDTRAVEQMTIRLRGDYCLTHDRPSVWCLLEKRTVRIKELEDVLAAIRDKWVPALQRDGLEPDKTDCNALSIFSAIVRVLPRGETATKGGAQR